MKFLTALFSKKLQPTKKPMELPTSAEDMADTVAHMLVMDIADRLKHMRLTRATMAQGKNTGLYSRADLPFSRDVYVAAFRKFYLTSPDDVSAALALDILLMRISHIVPEGMDEPLSVADWIVAMETSQAFTRQVEGEIPELKQERRRRFA